MKTAAAAASAAVAAAKAKKIHGGLSEINRQRKIEKKS